jgi:hypothetical protein
VRDAAANRWSRSYTWARSCVLLRAGAVEEPVRTTRGKQMQSAQPRDIGVLVFVIGLFLVLFVVTLLMGTPVR